MKNHLIRLFILLFIVTQGLVAEEKLEPVEQDSVAGEEEKETFIKDLVKDYEETLGFFVTYRDPESNQIFLKITEDQVMVDHKLYHELYHSFQKNLYEKNCKVGSDDLWIVEGAASYFADYMSFRDYGWMSSFPSGILRHIHETKWENRELTSPVSTSIHDKHEY